MVTMTYNLLLTEALVAEAAPISLLYPKVGKNQKAVEVGANLPIKNEKIEVEKVNSKISKYLYLYNVKYQSFPLSELTLNVTIPPYLPQQSRVRIYGLLAAPIEIPNKGFSGWEASRVPHLQIPKGGDILGGNSCCKQSRSDCFYCKQQFGNLHGGNVPGGERISGVLSPCRFSITSIHI